MRTPAPPAFAAHKMCLRDRCLFCDDRVSNLEGAQKAGMRPVHMDREDRRSWPGERVRDLLELARLVNA